MKLVLIRHGKTDYSIARRYCGFSDPPLNDEGVRQSRQLAARVRGLRIDKVYSSDLLRARQTARILFPQDAIESMAAWREMNFGLFEGLTYQQIMEKYAALYRNWVANPEQVKPPDGEGLRDLSKRVKEQVATILSRHDGRTVAVVTHGGPIRVVLSDALRLDGTGFWQVPQEFGAWNVIAYAADAPPVVIAMNDVSHLSAEEAVPS